MAGEEPFLKLAYLSFFILGIGYLLPWNAFITAVDYFDFLYPGISIDRVFSIVYMFPSMALLLYLTFKASAIQPCIRINAGLVLFLVVMLVIPIISEDPSTLTHYVTVGAVSLTGLADALVLGSLAGSAGQLPECYMQALVAGTAASGVLVSALRIITKAALPSSPKGLRSSANVYFLTGVIFMLICLVAYNLVTTQVKNTRLSPALLVVQDEEIDHTQLLEKGTTTAGKVDYKLVWQQSGGLMLSVCFIHVVTLAIFPGSLTEDVHSRSLGDWYPILLIACYNISDFTGKAMTGLYLIHDPRCIIIGSFARFGFFPLFALCLHGPSIFHTEFPVFLITTLLGFTNGYFTSSIMIKGPKLVPLEYSETTGIMLVVFMDAGLALGSAAGWLWVL